MTLARGTDQIETERLVLRRIEQADLGVFTAIHADPDVARYIAHGRPRSPAETAAWLDATLASYAESGLGQLAVIAKHDQRLVGRCGLSDAAFECAPCRDGPRRGWFFRTHCPTEIAVEAIPELGYTFARDNWGQGFASEAAGAVYTYARTVLGLGSISSVIHADNHASLRVAAKYGVTFTELVEMSGQTFRRYAWPTD